MNYPERPYSDLSAEELTAEREKLARELSAKHRELAEIKSQYQYLFLRGYKDSTSTSVAGRDRDGEIAAYAVRQDELVLAGDIEAVAVIYEYLGSL